MAGSYVVNTGSTDESATAAGTLLKADGFVSAFGSAPPDFDATSVTPGSAVGSQLIVEWSNGGATAPFTSYTSAGLVVDLSNTNLGTTHLNRTGPGDRKSTRLNSSHGYISYAVFCLKKKNQSTAADDIMADSFESQTC